MNDMIHLFGFTTTALELLSFVLAVITVWLTIRQSHWSWLFAIVSSGTYGFVFYDARLYGDMALQLVFIAVSVWGWYQWQLGGEGHKALGVSRLTLPGWRYALGGWLFGYVVLAGFLKYYTDTDVPHADGFLTAGSLLGQLLLSRKKLENWHTWIAVDLLYVGLYLYKDLKLTAILYAIYVVLAILGLRTWRRAL
ncbi:MAG: nicotinamide riboside transporter PnuC [Pseudomonadota bacterium]